MSTTIEGVVENGQIRLLEVIKLPERAKVFFIIPEYQATPDVRISSPRLVHPEQAGDFAKQIIEGPSDARV